MRAMSVNTSGCNAKPSVNAGEATCSAGRPLRSTRSRSPAWPFKNTSSEGTPLE
jgi:hypothetical protein